MMVPRSTQARRRFALLVGLALAASPAIALAQEGREGQDPHGAAHEGHDPVGGEHAAGDEHGVGNDHEGHALKPINWTDFSNKEQPPYVALLLNFAILAGIYVYFGKKPVADALVKRRQDISKEIEEATRIKQEAEERAKIYQAKLTNLETELKEAREALVAAGQGERDRIIREAEETAQRMQRDAQFLIEQELKQLRSELTRETVEAAVLAAEGLIKARMTPSDQERLAEEYLADLSTHIRGGTVPPPRPGGGSMAPPSSRVTGAPISRAHQSQSSPQSQPQSHSPAPQSTQYPKGGAS